MRTARWGCLITIGLIILLIAGVAIWAYRSPRLEVPVRTYPPNNAYEHLATTAHRLSRALRSTPRLQALHARASDSRVPAPMSPADHAEYVRAVEPFLQGYRRYLDAPCKVVVDYSNPNTGAFSNGAAFRNLARVENYLIRSALARNQQAEAVERATALAKFANQVAREGATIDYLVAQAIRNVALEPLHQNIQRLNNRAALEQLLKWAREDERHRPALDQILETEHHYTRAMTLRVYQSYGQHTDPTNLEWWERMPVLPQVFVKSAIPEMERAWKQIKVYAAKPAHERRASDFPKVRHPYNEIVIPVFKEVIDREAAPAAKARLLGCVAAIRLHKQRTGRYPASLEALRLGELIVDPFSGKPFVYRVDPRRGFMIYSVGADKVDDGGVVEPRDLYGEQGDLAPHSPQNARRTDLWLR